MFEGLESRSSIYTEWLASLLFCDKAIKVFPAKKLSKDARSGGVIHWHTKKPTARVGFELK